MMTLEEARKQLKEFEDELANFTMEGEIAKVMKALGCQRRRAITIAVDNRVTILGNIRKMKEYVEQLENQDKDWLYRLKKAYPKGTRVKLVHMDDVQAPPIGTKGTVEGVDDIGSILVKWDNGSSLNVVYGEDKVERLPKCCICGSDIEGYGNNPAPVGGGAFSGKDPTKVDRSAAYMARHLAKSVVKELGAAHCLIQLGYVIGKTEPVSVEISTGDKCMDRLASKFISENFDLRPKAIIDRLDLLNVDYERVAEGCHYYGIDW